MPLVGIISRLSNQKGFDLIECVIRELMATGIQLVVLGMGEAKYTNLFSWAESEYPGRLEARFAMNHQLRTASTRAATCSSCPASSSRAASPR